MELWKIEAAELLWKPPQVEHEVFSRSSSTTAPELRRAAGCSAGDSCAAFVASACRCGRAGPVSWSCSGVESARAGFAGAGVVAVVSGPLLRIRRARSSTGLTSVADDA